MFKKDNLARMNVADELKFEYFHSDRFTGDQIIIVFNAETKGTDSDLDTFVHKVYINTARKVYRNIYLFEKNISPLQIQKNNREFEMIVQECIMTTIRDSIPTEQIIRAYMDESEEQEEEVIIEEVDRKDQAEEKKKEEEVVSSVKPSEEKTQTDEEEKPPIVPSIVDESSDPVITKLSFNDYDAVQDATTGNIESVEAPKDIDIYAYMIIAIMIIIWSVVVVVVA